MSSHRSPVRLKYWQVAIVVVLVDQISKMLARAHLRPDYAVDVISGFFRLTLVHNSGAAFGLFPGGRFFFVTVAVAVVVGLILYARVASDGSLLRVIALGLGVGGAAGNLVDRLAFGRVTDFLDFHFWPVFNLADSAIVVGLVTLALTSVLRGEES